jgi:hypothetical protein
MGGRSMNDCMIDGMVDGMVDTARHGALRQATSLGGDFS